MNLKLKNSDIYQLPGNSHMVHLGTITKGLREFIVMVCIAGPKQGNCYIEEIVYNTKDFSKDVFGNFKFIADDELAQELANFAQEKKITDLTHRSQELSNILLP